MVGDRPVNHHSRSLTLSDRLKAMFLARDSKIRESAAFAIGSYRGSDAHLLFEEAFSHPDADVRKNATHALRSYRGLDASLIFDKALTHSDREVRKGAASALGTYQGPDAYLLFEKAFAHSDVEVRKRAASVLGTYRGSDARLLLGKALTHSDIEIRKSAALALKFAEPVDAQTLHLLLELLKNEKQDIRNEVSSLIKDLYPHLFRMEEEKTKPLTDYLNLPCEKPIDQVFPTDDLDKIIKYLDQQDLVQ
jgi:HEAT repeat protein